MNLTKPILKARKARRGISGNRNGIWPDMHEEVAKAANAWWDANSSTIDGAGRVECALTGFQAGARWQARAALEEKTNGK